MVGLLARLFIKGKTTDAGTREKYGVLCGAVGIFLNILLFAGKFTAGSLSGSIAITSDAFNNLSDAGSSLVSLLGFKLAGQRADSGHPFGHGRMEYISGLVVAFLILLVGFELGKSSVMKIITPEAIEFSWLSAAILVVSVLIKIYMYVYNRSVGRKIDSASMSVTAADSLNDAIATTVVLLATLVFRFFGVNLDGWCGLLVALFILYTGVKAIHETISPLLGQPPTKEFVDSVKEIVTSTEGVCGIHDLVVHEYGPGRTMISLHAEVPADGDMLALHDIIDNLERELSEKLKCAAVIHMDPVAVGDPLTDHLKAQMAQSVKVIDPRLTIHDFRIVTGPSHTNLIFDIVAPFDLGISENDLRERVGTLVKMLGDNYFAVVTVDKSYL